MDYRAHLPSFWTYEPLNSHAHGLARQCINEVIDLPDGLTGQATSCINQPYDFSMT